MMCRKKVSPLRRRVRKTVALLLVLLTAFTVWFETAVKTQLRDVIIRDMLTLSEQSVTMAVDDYLRENADAGQRSCDVVYDGGSVAAISENTAFINAAKTYITARSQSYLDALSHEKGVSARLGNFTGLVFLSNFGPEITFPVDSAQTVSCEFHSSFESAGVNQTVHHITITVTADLLIYSPFHISGGVTNESTYEIAQTVIVGAVPTYSGVVTY